MAYCAWDHTQFIIYGKIVSKAELLNSLECVIFQLYQRWIINVVQGSNSSFWG